MSKAKGRAHFFDGFVSAPSPSSAIFLFGEWSTFGSFCSFGKSFCSLGFGIGRVIALWNGQNSAALRLRPSLSRRKTSYCSLDSGNGSPMGGDEATACSRRACCFISWWNKGFLAANAKMSSSPTTYGFHSRISFLWYSKPSSYLRSLNSGPNLANMPSGNWQGRLEKGSGWSLRRSA